MRILIGYSMRSGSTLLQHILGQHSSISASSDLSSFVPMLLGRGLRQGSTALCLKPMDLLFLSSSLLGCAAKRFDRFIWLTRDPRDSYLSSLDSGYAYLLWPPGPKASGVDLWLLRRWKWISARYLEAPEGWHLVRYEDLVTRPEEVIRNLFDYLGLSAERLLPFSRFSLLHGGDYKIRRTSTVHSRSVTRYKEKLSPEQLGVFHRMLGPEMQAFGYQV